MPVADVHGETPLSGVYVVGDLKGVPLLKFAADSGARAIRRIAAERRGAPLLAPEDGVEVLILGAGVAGAAAALEARKTGLSFAVIEAAEPFFTVANFPQGKPIFAYPTDLVPAGELQFSATVKESLLEDLRSRWASSGISTVAGRAERLRRRGAGWEVLLADGSARRAARVVIALGRSGHFRRLGVPGEDRDKVTHRLHDPRDHAGKDVLVVGGGDSALETAVALAESGARVTLSYRKGEWSRPKPENVERLNAAVNPRAPGAEGGFPEGAPRGALRLALGTRVVDIGASEATLESDGGRREKVPNDLVFVMAGREAPVEFFRRSGLPMRGESRPAGWVAAALFMVFLAALYDWKAGGFLESLWSRGSFPGAVPEVLSRLGGIAAAWIADRRTLLGTVAVSMKSRSFYYTLIYTALVGFFGWRRVRNRPTAYIKRQTATLFLVQLIPLFILPEIVLPWLGYNGFFTGGWREALADRLFEKYISSADYAAGLWPAWGHPRAYWRAYGFILAFPLNVYNVFTEHPNALWLGICFLQTFVLIPGAIYFFGKGIYCGWVCSCGGLAETLGDAQRSKMPHGPASNKWNMVGQAFLAAAVALLILRILSWVWPGGEMEKIFGLFFEGKNAAHRLVNPFSYKWIVDILAGGVIGVGLYFKYSGRVWCRFACPLAALMHLYARFSRFRILADKKKCISCNVCTSVCHQGIDVMNFANRGRPLADPECVRCSACVADCPTGVLSFGRVDGKDRPVALDRWSARAPTL